MFSGSSVDPPVIREWFVYPGNPLKEPDLVPPAQLSLPRTVSVTELKKQNSSIWDIYITDIIIQPHSQHFDICRRSSQSGLAVVRRWF